MFLSSSLLPSSLRHGLKRPPSVATIFHSGRPNQTVYQLRRFCVEAKIERGDRDGMRTNDVRDGLKRIDRYCKKLSQSSQEAIDCWDAYNFFADKAIEAEQQCDLDPDPRSMSSDACTNFLQWESFVRRLMASGGVKSMIKAILTLKNSEEHPITDSPDPQKTGSIFPISEFLDDAHTRELCERLFKLKDRDGDGRLNVEEFRSLMKLLGDEVRGKTVSTMFEALDIQGALDFEEFFTILEAESIRSHSKSAGMLRVAQKHGHSDDRPKWLDNV